MADMDIYNGRPPKKGSSFFPNKPAIFFALPYETEDFSRDPRAPQTLQEAIAFFLKQMRKNNAPAIEAFHNEGLDPQMLFPIPGPDEVDYVAWLLLGILNEPAADPQWSPSSDLLAFIASLQVVEKGSPSEAPMEEPVLTPRHQMGAHIGRLSADIFEAEMGRHQSFVQKRLSAVQAKRAAAAPVGSKKSTKAWAAKKAAEHKAHDQKALMEDPELQAFINATIKDQKSAMWKKHEPLIVFLRVIIQPLLKETDLTLTDATQYLHVQDIFQTTLDILFKDYPATLGAHFFSETLTRLLRYLQKYTLEKPGSPYKVV